MQRVLVVVDMQNDFIDGALGTPEAQAIVPFVKEKIRSFDGKVIFTRDTHQNDYLQTQEGAKLPIPHCINGTQGWEICDELKPFAKDIIDKPTFGSTELVRALERENSKNQISEIELVGLCTDICVISNAMLLKSSLLETEIVVDSTCCAGVTPQSHQNALEAMKMCQINIK
ncbi:MAG: cysteine hydrolase [Ruminococcaceae bacterium]|nr:cysteine hydrolase [Oscillospiraceae bacterium]